MAGDDPFSETGIIYYHELHKQNIMKPRTQLLIAVLAIATTLFVWWITIQERSTLLGDPNKRTDSTKVNYSKESMP
jgi:hypothetical protein